MSVSGCVNYAGVLENVTVQPGSLAISKGGLKFYETGTGLLFATGGSNGDINYETGLWRLNIAVSIMSGLPLTAAYRAVGAQQVVEVEPSFMEVSVENEAQGATINGASCYSLLPPRGKGRSNRPR